MTNRAMIDVVNATTSRETIVQLIHGYDLRLRTSAKHCDAVAARIQYMLIAFGLSLRSHTHRYIPHACHPRPMKKLLRLSDSELVNAVAMTEVTIKKHPPFDVWWIVVRGAIVEFCFYR